jgi:hypothetical protein
VKILQEINKKRFLQETEGREREIRGLDVF